MEKRVSCPFPKNSGNTFNLMLWPIPHFKGKNQYILLCVDLLTGYVIVDAGRNQRASTNENFLYHILKVLGVPKVLQVDQRTNFRSKRLNAFCEKLGIGYKHSLPHLPESQGEVENMNGVIGGR